MKIKLKDLNTEIESWLDRTYEVAIDKDFYISTILKISKMYIESAKDPKTIYYETSYAYQLYKLGEFEEAEQSIDMALEVYIKEINNGNIPEHILSLLNIDSYNCSPPYIKKNSKQETALRIDLHMMVKDFFYHSEAYRILGKKYPEFLTHIKTNESIDFGKTDITIPTKIEVPKEIAIKHFSVFKLKNERNNNNAWLTDEQFDTFIEKIYGTSVTEKIELNMGKGEKLFIVDRFYTFFQLGLKEYNAYARGTESYIRLLTDNFENFNYNTVSNNFKPSKDNARSWKVYEKRLNIN